ncbi:MAG: 16S rRNA (cytosine(1402)-N(4))-methyltransferase RsmH [Candidatus Azambacteria bacterium]|nr:16S rRNA (cytosine(1402)-N(4))-methyltransferase RsmH [Candidatus Azambacteria bacterium]
MPDVIHTPVLLQEVLEALNPKPGQCFIDATANGGGHTFALWDRVKPNGMILAIDKDHDLVERLTREARERKANVIAVAGSYGDLAAIASAYNVTNVAGILFDLGYSSYHIDQSGRGFSFQKDEPLLMRYESEGSTKGGMTAAEAVNQLSEEELADIIYQYGEDRLARRIASTICVARKRGRILTTKQLADIVAQAYPKRMFSRINPATKTFQALRIFVNQELAELERVLPQARDILAEDGVIAIITFHSLEDRIVKRFFQSEKGNQLDIITKKPIVPTPQEAHENRRARSAKLRVAVKKHTIQ